MKVLVLHGPNLNLLGERPEDDPSHSLEELDQVIRDRVKVMRSEVKILQSNHEGALIDALHAERRWADVVLLNPGALAHTSYALRDAISAIQRPVMEVHLTDLTRREEFRRVSVLRDVCVGQSMGQGYDSYLYALDSLAQAVGAGEPLKPLGSAGGRAPTPVQGVATAAWEGEGGRKTLGRKLTPVLPMKSLGRAMTPSPGRAMTPNTLAAAVGLSRTVVQQQIGERLAGRLTPAALASWARAQWQLLQVGGAVEAAHRPALEDALQRLILSTTPATRLSDEQLVDMIAELDA